MKINKVSIIIENVDEENASINLVTDPVASEADDIEDTPCVLLGSYVWAALQDVLGEEDEGFVSSVTLQ